MCHRHQIVGVICFEHARVSCGAVNGTSSSIVRFMLPAGCIVVLLPGAAKTWPILTKPARWQKEDCVQSTWMIHEHSSRDF